MNQEKTDSTAKRVLVATDFSPASEAALRIANTLAIHDGSRLGVSHVVKGVGAIHPIFTNIAKLELEGIADVQRRATTAVESHIQAVLGLGQGGADVLVAVTSGSNEAETIAEQARDDHASLVVVGSHGRTGVERVVLGSVAEKVARLAPCDVLVARETKNEGGPVIAAVDLGDPTAGVLRKAAREAARRKVDLIAAFALDTPPDVVPYGLLGPFGIYVTAPDPKGHADVREAAEKALRAALAAADVRATVTILDGRATRELVVLAETKGASLVVCATHARTGVARALLGSVAESVIRHAPCSVLVART